MVFNRPDTTAQVFEAIRQAKPPRLYVAADGPREGREGEAERVAKVRQIATAVDWPCEVKTLFRDKNLGCKFAVSSAITWFFEEEDQGIILEDDCLPSQSFFWFCEAMLNKYKNDESIYVISGHNRLPEDICIKEDYVFCKYSSIWGWASWASVWKNYDVGISTWPVVRKRLIKNISTHIPTQRFWNNVFDKTYNREIDTWDYQLLFLMLSNSAMGILPRLNLVSNIGFGPDATHTFIMPASLVNNKAFDISPPFKNDVSASSKLSVNKYMDESVFSLPNIFVRIFNRMIKFIRC